MITEQERQEIIDTEHLNIMSIAHMVYGVLGIMIVGFCSVYALLFTTAAITGSANEGAEFQLGMGITALVCWILVAAATVWAVGMIVSGYKIRKRKWLNFSLWITLPCLFSFPTGTTLGVLNIMLFLRPSVKELYNKTDVHTITTEVEA